MTYEYFMKSLFNQERSYDSLRDLAPFKKNHYEEPEDFYFPRSYDLDWFLEELQECP